MGQWVGRDESREGTAPKCGTRPMLLGSNEDTWLTPFLVATLFLALAGGGWWLCHIWRRSIKNDASKMRHERYELLSQDDRFTVVPLETGGCVRVLRSS